MNQTYAAQDEHHSKSQKVTAVWTTNRFRSACSMLLCTDMLFHNSAICSTWHAVRLPVVVC
jgi:hypothetical protein